MFLDITFYYYVYLKNQKKRKRGLQKKLKMNEG